MTSSVSPAPAAVHTVDAATGARRFLPSAESLRRLGELFVLTGFAIAQPLLDVTGRAPEYFVYQRIERGQILLFVAVVTVLPTILLWLAEQIIGVASAVVRRAVHVLFVWTLLTALAIQIAKKLIPDRGYSLLGIGAVVGAAAAAVLVRSSIMRTFLRYLTPAPLVFAVLFVATTPAGALLTASTTRQAPAGSIGTRPPIVMIVLDEFPTESLLNSKGLVDERLFPNFAALGRDSTWFRQASAVSGATVTAVPSLLNGRYPAKSLAPSYRQYPSSLFTLLSGTYDVQASETLTELCPPDVCRNTPEPDRKIGLAQIVRESADVTRQIVSPFKSNVDPADQFSEAGVADAADQSAQDPNADSGRVQLDPPRRFHDFVASLAPRSRPTLHYLHLLMPHTPFRYLPSGARYSGAARLFHDENTTPGQPITGGELGFRQRHLLQLGYTDKLLGEVVQRLKQQGLYDDALVVVTADHGRAFDSGTQQRPSRLLKPGNEHELCYVPTFIKAPGQQAGRIDDRNWEQVDLLPTVADMLDVEVPWRMDGFSGLGPERRPGTDRFWFQHDGGKRIKWSSTGPRKTMMRGMASELARPELGVNGLFAFGPHRDLVGRKVSDLALGAALGARAVTNVGPVVRLDPQRASHPYHIWGTVTGVSTNTPIAVAVNGEIAAVPLVFRHSKNPSLQVAGMTSDALYRKGRNDVALFVVERANSQTTLRPIQLAKR